MKSSLVLALLGCAAAASQAQSTVQVFGTLDLGLNRIHNAGGTRDALRNNGASTTKIGFRGTEDLGDGLSAGFWLESQVDANSGLSGGSNGTAQAFWNRRSTVSLASARLGELRLGRDYTPAFGIMADFDPANTNGSGNALNLWTYLGSNAVTQVRANSAVSYFTPGGLAGFSAQVMAAPSQGLVGQKYLGARANYNVGALKLSAAFGQTDTTLGSGPQFKTNSLGGAYNLGPATVQGYANHNSYNGKSATTVLVGVVVPFGLSEVRASYQRLDASGAGTDANDAHQLFVGYWYWLSKRTSVYANVAQLKNQGAAAYGISGGAPVGSATGFKATGYDVGLRHFF